MREIGDLRKEILDIISKLVYKYDRQMQLKKNGTPRTRTKVDSMQDSLEFKNNFFSLTLIVLSYLTENDIETTNNFEVLINDIII